MLEQFAATWAAMASSYLSSPLQLAGGAINAFTLVATAGLLLLVAGLVAAVVLREKQALWLIPPAIAALLTPIVLGLANAMTGWLGMGFALVLGGVGLLLWIGMISGDATRRLPVWLLGFALLSFVIYCGLISIAVIWGLA